MLHHFVDSPALCCRGETELELVEIRETAKVHQGPPYLGSASGLGTSIGRLRLAEDDRATLHAALMPR